MSCASEFHSKSPEAETPLRIYGNMEKVRFEKFLTFEICCRILSEERLAKSQASFIDCKDPFLRMLLTFTWCPFQSCTTRLTKVVGINSEAVIFG